MTLRVCLNRSVIFPFSLARELSPFLFHEHVLNLLVSKLFILSLHSLYKFHVSCFVFAHFNSLPPACFNRDFHDYLTRSRSTCIKCPSGINLLLVFKKPRKLTDHGKQLLPRALISNVIVFYDKERIMEGRWGEGGGGDVNIILNTFFLIYCIF